MNAVSRIITLLSCLLAIASCGTTPNGGVSAQPAPADSSHTSTALPDTSQPTMTVLKEADLNDVQRAALKSLHSDWLTNTFTPALDKGGFKQDCKDCGDIFWYLDISIGPDGKVLEITTQRREVDCSKKSDDAKKALETTVLNGVRDLVFPASLRNVKLTCRFGQVTRC